MLFIDFETASDLDVTEVGAYVYAEHPSTLIRCMAWAIDDGPVSVWLLGEPFPDALIEAVQRGTVHAWNAQFERLIWTTRMPRTYLCPTFNQWRCSAALSRINGLPGALDDCARVLKTEHQKLKLDKRWTRASHVMTRADNEAIAAYCANDVATERDIEQRLTSWTDDELYVYQLNERINDRGVLIDREFCVSMTKYLAFEAARLNTQLFKITGGAVEKVTQVQRLKSFIASRTAFLPMTLNKNAVTLLLRSETLDPVVRRVLEIRQDGGMSSVSKYGALLERASNDNRVRGMFVFAGAGQTGRFSSTGAQLHNLVRSVPDDYEELIATVKRVPPGKFHLLDGRPITKLASQLIRPSLIAPAGYAFIIGDYSAVEAKGLPWLANNTEEIALWASGVDRYIEDACNALNLTPDKVGDKERQIGKVVRLACGFSGRKGAVLSMAESYGIDMPAATAKRIADNWHAANPWVERFAKSLEQAALSAVANPGRVYEVNEKIKYWCDLSSEVPILRCMLPSGRVISYHDCRAEESPFGGYVLSSIKPRETTRERLWHGLFAENVTQAVCNDLLRHSMVLLGAMGFVLVAHVHDENVAEVILDAATPERVAAFKRGMEERSKWALDFPLVAKVTVATRYKK
jgi:DNA polymerase bacteriophage-type